MDVLSLRLRTTDSVNTVTAVIHRKYLYSDVNTIDRNIDYRSECSSMIYDKTYVSQ